jgi:hypothetical protein
MTQSLLQTGGTGDKLNEGITKRRIMLAGAMKYLFRCSARSVNFTLIFARNREQHCQKKDEKTNTIALSPPGFHSATWPRAMVLYTQHAFDTFQQLPHDNAGWCGQFTIPVLFRQARQRRIGNHFTQSKHRTRGLGRSNALVSHHSVSSDIRNYVVRDPR